MPNDADNSRTPASLTEYEQKLLDALRAERRARSGAAAVPPARVPIPAEPAETGGAPDAQVSALIVQLAKQTVLPDSAMQRPQSHEAPECRLPMPEPESEPVPDREPPPAQTPLRHDTAPQPAARSSRWRLSLWLAAAPAVVFLAVFGILALNVKRGPLPDADKKAVTESQAGRSTLPDGKKAASGQYDNLITERGDPEPGESLTALDTLFAGQAGRPGGRESFRKSLLNTASDSPARRSYLELARDRVRLRAAASESGAVLESLAAGTYVRVQERSGANGWCKISLAEGRTGWLKCDFLKPIA